MTTWRRVVWSAVVVAVVAATSAQAKDDRKRGRNDDHWVGTWTTSVVDPAVGLGKHLGPGFTDQTLRMIVHTSIGGTRARVRFSNTFGTAPLKIGAAHLAIRASGAAIVPASDRTLTFSGQPSITIPGGALVVSDPVTLDVPALGDLAVSVYLPESTGAPTGHIFSMQTNYTSTPGDFTSAADLPLSPTQYCFVIGGRPCITPWYFVSAVEVMASKDTHAIVTLGDSITDGESNTDASTMNANLRWPDGLARRLLARKGKPPIAILNQGIAGDRVLSNGGALARLDRDVLVQSGAKWVVLLQGINDCRDTPVSDQLIAAYQQIIARAHAMGLTIIGATMTPAGASGMREQNRSTVNAWIRSSGAFDAIIDFDAATRDPANPTFMRAEYDSGDHLHPNGAGYQAMANAIDLALFDLK
jgi:lysophospholipase L1-like esterase